MTISDLHHARVTRGLVAIAALLGGTACNDYARTNPFDPEATVPLVLTGPDSVTSIGDTVAFELRSTQVESLATISNWFPPTFLTPLDGRGRFIVTAIPNVPRATGTITASVNANAVSKTITFSQQPTSLVAADCYDGQKAISFTSLLVPTREALDAQFVCLTLKDRRGFPVPDASSVTRTIRDQRVVRFVDAVGSLNALAVGSTYVVYARAGLADSVRVDVRQVPARLTRDPPACLAGIRLSPGQTVRVSALPPLLDGHGIAVTDTVLVQKVLTSLVWSALSPLNVTVGQDGFVTALSPSSGYVIASYYEGTTQLALMFCRIDVN
jgi:hypothetical protein